MSKTKATAKRFIYRNETKVGLVKMRNKKISIIILNWNGLKDTAECLESVIRSDYINYEIIVVDNGSTDGSVTILKEKYPFVTIIENKENIGFVGGCNIGIKAALEKNGVDYVWLLNNDTIIEPNTLSELVVIGESNPAIGLLSPIIYYYSNPSTLQYCGAYFDWENHTIKNIKDVDGIDAVNERDVHLWGTALLIKKCVIDSIGLLNEKYFAYFEDTEYSLRAIRAGFVNRIIPSAKIFHKAHYYDQDGEKTLPTHFFYYITRNGYLFWNAHFNGTRKIPYLRKHFVAFFKRIGHCKELYLEESVNACFDGMRDALRGNSGKWIPAKRSFSIFRRLILMRPYLLADIISLDFKNIFSILHKRCFKK